MTDYAKKINFQLLMNFIKNIRRISKLKEETIMNTPTSRKELLGNLNFNFQLM